MSSDLRRNYQMDFAETVGRVLGTILGVTFVVAVVAAVLFGSWNACVPAVFGLSEITFGQSVSILGVVWSVAAIVKLRA